MKSNAMKKAAAMTLVFVLAALIQACDQSQMMVIMSFMMGMMGGNGAAFGGAYGDSSSRTAALMGSSMGSMYSAANNSGGANGQTLDAYLRSSAFRQTATQGYNAYRNGQSTYPQANQTYTPPQYQTNPSVTSDATRGSGLTY